MNKNKIILLITLILLLLSVSYATEVSNGTVNCDDTLTKTVQTSTHNVEQNIEQNVIKEKQDNNKEIKKTAANKTTKKLSNSYNVTDFKSLHEALTTSTYETVTVNINSNITLEGNTTLNESIKTVILNGNGKTINGNYKFNFLNINQNNSVTIKNIIITSCKTKSMGGAIYNEGILTINNTSLYNNIAELGGAIYNKGTITITCSTLNKNTAKYNGRALYNNGFGGAIYNEGKLTINNSTLNKNTAKERGGAICNRRTLTINNSTLNNNEAVYYGGAIYNEKTLTVNKCTLNNNTSDYGGAVCSFGKITINYSTLNNNTADCGGALFIESKTGTLYNCTLTNNIAELGGAIFDSYEAVYIGEEAQTFIIKKCTLTNNTADCGGAIVNRGQMRIIDSIIQDNTANQDGGAIHQEDYVAPSLLMNKTVLKNNIAKQDGGAIYAVDGYFDINNCTLTNNTANQDGGAIYGYSYFDIRNSIFQYNNATRNGGALSCSGIIINCTLTNNTANRGGAIDFGSGNITNSTLENNTAENDGGAIYADRFNSLYIENNTFITNKANTNGTAYNKTTVAIINKANTNGTAYNKTTVTITNNTNSKTSIYSGTVYVNEFDYYVYNAKVSIKNNIFDDKITNTKTIINKITRKEYKDNITIIGKFKDINGKVLANTKLKLNINGKIVTVKTNTKGVYTYNTKARTIGKNNITVTFPGSTNYNKSTAKTTFTVSASKTKLTIPTYKQKQYKQKVIITGKLKDKNNNIIQNAKIKIKVNNKIYNTKTNNKGIYEKIITANKIGTNNVTVTFPGNKYYKKITKKTTFKTLTRTTKLTVNKIKTTTKGRTVKITGKLTDIIKSKFVNIPIKLKINSKTVYLKTNKYGVYTYKYKTTTRGTNKVTVTFAGSTNYKKSSAKTSFTVR